MSECPECQMEMSIEASPDETQKEVCYCCKSTILKEELADMKAQRDDWHDKYERQFKFSVDKHKQLIHEKGLRMIANETNDRICHEIVKLRLELDEGKSDGMR